jgi:polyferredoxin
VCPFGAAQELASRIPARKLRLPPALVRHLVTFRRILWAALMLALWCRAFDRWMEWELFGAFAWRAVHPVILVLALLFVILSVFVPRAYCRFVCPTGTLFKLSEANSSEGAQ